MLLLAAVVIAPTAGAGRSGASYDKGIKAYLSPGLLDAAKANPNSTFDVIVQGSGGESTAEVATEVRSARDHDPGRGVGVRNRFRSLSAVAAELTGRQNPQAGPPLRHPGDHH